MTANERAIKWRKKQRILTVTLNPNTDKDIIDFIDKSEMPNATLTKQVFRAYIAMQAAMGSASK